ncbi:MAG: DUF1015 domain-containing protein [Burkholderiales bacterium]
MAALKPFRGLRPPKELAQQIASPPYDVVSTDEARAFAAGNPSCFFQVSRPEIGPLTGDEYETAARNLQRFHEERWMQRDEERTFYVYRQQISAHMQTGIVAAASVAEYDSGLIKKHELTRPDKEDDRARHIHALQANDEPVFLTYRADAEIDVLIAELTQTPPEYDFVSEDKVAHTFWIVPSGKSHEIEAAFEKVPTLYIADGHHRIAAASRVRKLVQGEGESGKFLAVAFPHDQVQILAYNRVVTELNGLSRDAFLDKLSGAFRVNPTTRKEPGTAGTFFMYLQKSWYEVRSDASSHDLDVAILQERVLSPILGIGDPRTDSRIQFVGGIRGTQELEKLVDSGKHAVAFSLFPTSVEQLFSVADRGGIMPPKSTWFEPKLRSGLVVHPFF